MLKRITTIIVSIVAVAAIVCAYGGYVRPAESLAGKLAPLAVMAWPVVALLLVILTAFAAIIKSRGWIPGVAAIGICFVPLATICPVHLLSGEVPPGSREIKLLTFNVMGFKGYDDEQPLHSDRGNNVLSFIISRDADVVCLQEADTRLRAGRYGMSEAQIDTLRAMYPYIIYRSEGALEVLSKFPAKFFSIPKAGAYSRYPYMGAILDIDGVEVALANCHLESIGLNGEDKQAYEEMTDGDARREALSRIHHSAIGKLNAAFRQRAAQVDSIIATVDTIPVRASIVCGDFNDVPLSYAIRSLEHVGFTPVYPATGLGPAVTYHANKFYFRIDHILTRGPIEPISVRIFRNGLSDHYAMEATLAIVTSHQ
ncbi:MAG: endonuclease/exonuclease/phosphatase family protein [Candidatus Amulumruptor caecigallinarius]|nr:endonuclease/exonuclease/phosphatase family protein [Candidatus Amulumruptor caecigallinarius]MCM1397307.1 endonuclease/exonuclease/phosphatase family protein [Candidatus Amulumruptor caecigallinarius]MCM1453628.1 endonuclease/exonuclease/phosphatase family protein [bacterium]